MRRQLTERERELLRIISQRKLVRRDHLEIICEPYRIAGKYRANILNRAIERLFSDMYVDKVHETQKLGRGNSPCVVALDRAGSLYLGLPHKQRISHKKYDFNNKVIIERNLPNYFRHTHGINKLEVETILLFEKGDNRIIKWEHEFAYTFFNNQEKTTLIPDVFAVYGFEGKPVYAYIEYDTGSEDRGRKDTFPIIYKKIQNYKKLKVSEIWREHAEYFPIILFVTEDDKRVGYFTEKCKELGLQGWGVYHERYTDVVKRLGKLV